MARLRSGFLLKEILDRSANSTVDPEQSMYVYSTHDTIIAYLMQTLGIFSVRFL